MPSRPPAAARDADDPALLARLQAELADTRATLARAVAARERAGVTTDLVSVAADELRAPATAVSGYLQLMVDGEIGPLAPDQQHMLECALFHTRRMLELVDDLVDGHRVADRPSQHRQARCARTGPAARPGRRRRGPLARQVRLELRLAECPQVVGRRGDHRPRRRLPARAGDHVLAADRRRWCARCTAPPRGVAIEVSDQGMSPDPAALNALMDGRDPGAAERPAHPAGLAAGPGDGPDGRRGERRARRRRGRTAPDDGADGPAGLRLADPRRRPQPPCARAGLGP